jgi:hypothetical protein
MGVCYSYEQKEDIKERINRREEERILRENEQRNLNLKVLKSFWKITEEELHNIPFTEKSINKTPFVTPFYNLFFETRPTHLEHNYRNTYISDSMILESHQRKNNQHYKYAKYNDYQHIIERIIAFQKIIGNLQDLKVLLGPINYKILYNTLAYGIRNN